MGEWAAGRQPRVRALPGLVALLHQQAAQRVLWAPVALGSGIGLWFATGSAMAWQALLFLFAALSVAGLAAGGQAGRMLLWLGLLAASGLALIWMRAEWVAAPRIDRPVTATLSGKVEMVEHMLGRGVVRLTLMDDGAHRDVRVRVSVDDGKAGAVAAGDHIAVPARLMPPRRPHYPADSILNALPGSRASAPLAVPLAHPWVLAAGTPDGF